MKRISAFVIILLSVLFMPFWVTVALSVLGIFLFDFYFEAIFLMLLADLLYGVHEVRFSSGMFILFISALTFLTLSEFLKKKLKFYPK